MTGIDISKADLKTIEKKLRELKVEYDSKNGFNMARGVDNLGSIVASKLAVRVSLLMCGDDGAVS